jgi:hypothetical protein
VLCRTIFGRGASVAGFVKTREPIAGVAHPPFGNRPCRAANSTIQARSRIRTSVLVERFSVSSINRSSVVSVIVVAGGMVFIHSLNHDSRSSDSGY